MKSIRISAILILACLIIWGCSRKEDEALPERTGDLLVQFTIHEESNHLSDPENIPVIVSLYMDTLHTRLVISEDVVVAEDIQTEVRFEDVVSNFYWLEILVNESDLPPQCPDVRVFVRQDLTTTTDALEYTLREDLWVCPNSGP